MTEADAFNEFKNESAQHTAIVTSVGTLIISVKIGGDKQALIDFQPVAERILKIGAENNRDVETRGQFDNRGVELYSQIIVHP